MLKQFVFAFVFVSFTGAFIFAQEKPETGKKDEHHKMEQMKHDSTMQKMHHKMNHEVKSESKNESSIVHQGEINLAAIDLNKDGKVYQDQMCWNVISDEPGECPLCGMILKEVSLEKAKENLVKHDFKIKGN
ncbi:MAG: heavy metal-binding domain-containing protein [Ignavibacteriaceae bacterium]|jgi:rubrerythrin|nr:heavy metal-binding domain-containing protein [Ignavibacteriaceae bacterium]